MLEILYEWITKPYNQWSIVDGIVCFIEVFGIIALCILIHDYYIKKFWGGK